jgi:3-isopropylmalate dehydrogenase
MLLDFLGEENAALSLENAIIAALGKLKGMSAGKMGFTTSEVGDLVVQAIAK